MTKETFRIADNAIAKIMNLVRKEKIRQDLRDLLLDLDRKFESVLKLREKFVGDDDCRETEEQRPTLHVTVSSPHLSLYGYHEKLARPRRDRHKAILIETDHDDDKNATSCFINSTNIQCGKKRSQPRVGIEADEESNAAADKLDVVPLSPVDTMTTWSRGDEEEDDDDDDQLWLLIEDDDHDPRYKRRCSSIC